MIIGYIRVSTDEQNLDLQRDALTEAGAEKIYEDKASGSKMDRPGLAEALRHLRQGDVFMVWKLDRLGRTMRGLIELVEGLAARGVDFRGLTDGIDTTTPAGRFFFHILAALAQMERDLIRERTRAGLTAARARAPNRRTLGLRMGLVAAGASPEVAAQPPRLQPLELMLDVMNDASLPLEVRLNAARWAAPYVHHHKGQVDISDISRPLMVQVIRFAGGAGEIETLKTIEHNPQGPAVPRRSH